MMNLFKAIVMCDQCGEVHAEKWLESTNRHATTTTLFMLCEPCAMNNIIAMDSEDDFDPFGEHPADFITLDNDGNPLPDDVDPFDNSAEIECPVCCTGAVANHDSGMCDDCEQLNESERELM
jgi:protein-arginine kinase activator protein McsA